MFLPIGDDVDTRTLPLMGLILICICCMMWVHTGTLWRESYEAWRAKRMDPEEVVGINMHTGKPVRAKDVIDFSARNKDDKKWEKFIRKWGLVPADLAKGEYHQVLTHMFLHADLGHLLGNMFVLWAFIGTLEATLGAPSILALYIFWGIVAGLAQALTDWGGDRPCIGASGAIAGIMGAYFVCFGAFARIKVWVWLGFWFKPFILRIPAGFFLTMWIMFQIYAWAEAQKQQVFSVAFIAHIGGFGIGMLTMLLLKDQVLARLKMDEKGAMALKRAEEPDYGMLPKRKPLSASRAANEMTGSAAPSGEVAPAPATQGLPNCTHCGTPVADQDRVMDELYRCPNCRMLLDTSLPPPPVPRDKRSGTNPPGGRL